MEKILEIKEVTSSEYWGGFDGYEIHTDKQVIKLLIASHQSCCESWGYFMSEDNIEEFVGSSLINITLTDTALNTSKLVDVYEGGIMFVNLNTTRGLLQFVAYNCHNGYYGHEAKVISAQLEHNEYL